MDKLSNILLNENIKCITIGTLNPVQVAFIKEKCPDFSENIKGHSIILWKDRLQHINKHAYDNSHLSTEEMIDLLPQIIKEPDYIGYRKKDMSIQFIKKIDDNILMAVRSDSKGRLCFRTMYTITEGQISDYIKKDCAWKFSVDNKPN